MSALLTSFYPQILSELPKCPKVLVRDMILQTCIQFCEEALIDRVIQAPYSIVAGTRDYPFVQPTDKLVFKVMSAELAGVPIDYETPEALDVWFPGWRKATGTYQSGTFALTQLNALGFMAVPTPSGATVELILDVALKPTNTANNVADILYTEYYQEICWGTKAQLMLMTGHEWSNPAMAVTYGKMFDDAMKGASTRQQEGFGRPRIRTRAQFL